MAVAGDGSLLFAGPSFGLYRTTSAFSEQARLAQGIPASIEQSERFNHVGDVEFDPREGGRLLAPLECYYPFSAPPPDTGNPCGYGAFGVVDPVTLAWRYEVRLAGIPKAMWVALSPDGLLWSQSGTDLIAYRADDVNPANAYPAAPIQPVARVAGAAPVQYTGAAFLDGRLYVAAQPSDGLMQIYSIDLATGVRTLEIEQKVRGESEGLAAFAGAGGTLHWLVAPGTVRGATFGGDTSALLHFVPRGTPPPGAAQHLARIRLKVAHRRHGRRVTLRVLATARVAGRLRRVAGATVKARRATAFTLDDGRATLSVRAPKHGRIVVRATAAGYSAGTRSIRP